MLTFLQMKAWGGCFNQRTLTSSLHQFLVICIKHVKDTYVCLDHVSACVLGTSWYVVPHFPLCSFVFKGFYLSFERHLRKCMPAVKAWFILHCIRTVWFCNVHFGIKSVSLHLYKGFFFLRSWLYQCAFLAKVCALTVLVAFSVYVKVCLIFLIKENITYVYNALQE